MEKQKTAFFVPGVKLNFSIEKKTLLNSMFITFILYVLFKDLFFTLFCVFFY